MDGCIVPGLFVRSFGCCVGVSIHAYMHLLLSPYGATMGQDGLLRARCLWATASEDPTQTIHHHAHTHTVTMMMIVPRRFPRERVKHSHPRVVVYLVRAVHLFSHSIFIYLYLYFQATLVNSNGSMIIVRTRSWWN